jgi:SAM-dependent methyltransferase
MTTGGAAETQRPGSERGSVPPPSFKNISPELEKIKGLVSRRYRYLARDIWCASVSALFIGDNVECPICGQGAPRWVSLGFGQPLCPHCLASDRNRLISLYLKNELAFGARPLRVLHFAPEHCFLRRFAKVPNVTYIAADIDPPKGAVKIDITDIPLDTDSIDLVICSHVLEHIADDGKAMRELRRVMRPSGTALIMCPVYKERATTYEDASIISPQDRLVAFGQTDHVRLYGADFSARLEHAGFQVDENHYAVRLGEPAMKRYGIKPSAVIYVCS